MGPERLGWSGLYQKFYLNIAFITCIIIHLQQFAWYTTVTAHSMCNATKETLDKPTQRQACSRSELRLPIRRLSSRYYTLCTVHYTLVHSCTESSAALLHRCCGSKRDPSHMPQCPFQANPNNSWQQHTMRYPLVSSKLLDHNIVT